MMQFSPSAGGLAESQTLAITAAAKRMKADGIDVAPFAAGEPDFLTPDFIREAGIQAIRDGRTKYGPAAGIAELRAAVAETMAASGFAGMTADRTVIGAGAKPVLYFGLAVLLEPGDEVIIPTPCWLSYPKMVQAVGGTCVYVGTRPDQGYVIDPDAVRAAITPRTKALILNSPGNPTGAVQPDDVQRELGRIAAEHGIGVISDEIYEHMTYAPARFHSFAELAPDAHDLTLIVNGVSKAYAMTGWRIGWGAGPKDWVQRMIRLQSHALSGPPDIAQLAALAALQGPTEERDAMCARFVERRTVMCEALNAIPDVSCPVPDGAFYVLPDVSAYLEASYEGEPIGNSTKLAALMLEHAHAAVVPGDVFEAPYAVRFSYACSQDDIRKGIARVADFLASLQRPATA
ncbi:MAG: pyridoxal phosphate-dependent aminotransferase [Planctomycetota bacterium]|nr:pyridoxal phosphate-dependent aminotransferase [Planctomycetota bacterium]